MKTITRKTDTELRQDVMDELDWTPAVESGEVGVAVKDGVVALTGFVKSYADRWSAQRAAERVHGVKAVANELEVRLPGTAQRSDADIARAATSALEWNTLVPEEQVKVTVSEGWVTLKGEVNWRFQRKEAERAVRNLTGVKGVTNLITVKSSVKPEKVEERIEEALRRSAEVDARKISVDTHDGTVTLRGTVRSWAEREEAENAAWFAPGVTNVVNEIDVDPGLVWE